VSGMQSLLSLILALCLTLTFFVIMSPPVQWRTAGMPPARESVVGIIIFLTVFLVFYQTMFTFLQNT
jgi:hypothetical protein